MDRRTTLKWVLAASAAWPALRREAAAADPVPAGSDGYGTDPNLQTIYHPGQLWPLTLSAAQRGLAAVLCDLIIPSDAHSPSASAVGVVAFIDEWVSAPYPDNRRDRTTVLEGFKWLDAEAARRGGHTFATLAGDTQHAICDAICDPARASAALRVPAGFFARYRDLTAGAFYSTPAGRKDVDYIGNVPLQRFDGAPPQLLKKLKLV
jgi:Gluconate 2-dehydrogenase subunit 3